MSVLERHSVFERKTVTAMLDGEMPNTLRFARLRIESDDLLTHAKDHIVFSASLENDSSLREAGELTVHPGQTHYYLDAGIVTASPDSGVVFSGNPSEFLDVPVRRTLLCAPGE
ncbi:MAG TPA: hypothetical protein VNA13_02545, partial [Xanthomonadales bacterium]|nr:hypothetical protein [Xanthomonadales bacterium]